MTKPPLGPMTLTGRTVLHESAPCTIDMPHPAIKVTARVVLEVGEDGHIPAVAQFDDLELRITGHDVREMEVDYRLTVTRGLICDLSAALDAAEAYLPKDNAPTYDWDAPLPPA